MFQTGPTGFRGSFNEITPNNGSAFGRQDAIGIQRMVLRPVPDDQAVVSTVSDQDVGSQAKQEVRCGMPPCQSEDFGQFRGRTGLHKQSGRSTDPERGEGRQCYTVLYPICAQEVGQGG